MSESFRDHISPLRPQFMTIPEAATVLLVSEATVWRLIRSGSLPASRVGRQWRLNRAELIAAVQRAGKR